MARTVTKSSVAPVIAVTVQCLRSLLRTRFIPAMIIMLAVIGTVLPWTLHGDGTPEGEIKVLMTWSLGIILALLAVATLWTGCCMLSGEIHDGQFPIIRTSPAGKFYIWMGKWLGLSIVDGILLAGVMVLITAQAAIRGISLSEMNPKISLEPSEQTYEDFADDFRPRALKEGFFSEDIPLDEYRKSIIEKVKTDFFNIEPGKSFKWKFNYDGAPLRHGETPEAYIRFITPSGSLGDISGICRVFNSIGEQIAEYSISGNDKTEIRVPVDSSRFKGQEIFTVEVTNFDNPTGATIMLHPVNDSRLLIPSGSFAFNMVCTWLTLWSLLMALAGIGLATSSAFTSPVAIFVASALALMGLLSHTDMTSTVGCSHGNGLAAEKLMHVLEAPSRTILTAVSEITGPFTDADALASIGDRMQVQPKKSVLSFATVGLLLPLITGLFSAVILKFREFQ